MNAAEPTGRRVGVEAQLQVGFSLGERLRDFAPALETFTVGFHPPLRLTLLTLGSVAVPPGVNIRDV